jgi:Sulfotransferase domain
MNTRVLVEDMHGPRRLIARIRRNLYWGRTHGWSDLIEEHDLNLLVRAPRSLRKWQWRLHQPGRSGLATPILLVGAQRSGTNMIVHGLDEAAEVRVYNEGNRRAFSNFRLRPVPTLHDLIDRSPYRYVVFKPLCDTHRVDQLLAELEASRPARAVWVYRNVDGRTRSEVAKFGDANLRVIREFVAGHADHRWQVQRLSEASIHFIQSLDLDRMSPASGAALFWYIRNQLFFDLGLDRREDVLLVSYEAFLDDPATTMRRVCDFVGLEYRSQLISHIAPRTAAPKQPLRLDPAVRARCDALEGKLRAVARAPTEAR